MASANKAFPKVEFGEDNQTAYGECWTGAKVVFTGHSGIDAATGWAATPRAAAGGPTSTCTPAVEQTAGDPERGLPPLPTRSSAGSAQALAMRILKLEKQWNHDAFFDYVDRWMYEDDKPFRTEIAKYCKRPITRTTTSATTRTGATRATPATARTG